MKHNYHTHTTRCLHAVGSDEAYVQAAMEGGFCELGFADHMPWNYPDGFVSGCRMTMAELPDYLRSIEDLKARYAGQIEIHTGFEGEYVPGAKEHYLRLKDMGVEYFILGQHTLVLESPVSVYTPHACREEDNVLRYADRLTEGIATGLFTYVCHPDVCLGQRRGPDDFTPACERAADMICQAAREYNLPLEYNLLGLGDELEGHQRGYPSQAFWQYARKYDNDVILGVDAHSPAHLTDQRRWDVGVQRVKAMGYRLLDKVTID